ncbi:MAG: sn-glycerol-3-phosphate ABC transporter permease UgpE [Alphaproteobacteria bacterium]|jgi:sn-glycerol 3-phosphate transport system permease protein|nr:sn-glycerol-3-phosphate ABC transporter permease UgpE [Alphaproteobacteria bacterium]MDP6566127.1 sn-glycerol-3-phosphate ABC transporter permease UgpE [Alphaproteobacteria bacterium]MDP6813785.1 sn-glycerol-3-phosphate ABC transporter permease UgpE [Alphaproteobacteria bacterium]
MVENRPYLTFASHVIVIICLAMIMLPIWIAFVASTHPMEALLTQPIPMWPGDQFFENYSTVLGAGIQAAGGVPVGTMMFNSLVMALSITIGKIAISLIAAYAVVYFSFPFRMTCFWIIFITLMLPVEVRILPTFKVAADLGLLNTYAGLSLPLIASATATFLFRQFFLTVPEELTEAARIDGAGPLKFFKDILLPLSRTNIAALFVILFIYGWNQYLWPLLVTTEESFYTVVMGIQRMVNVSESRPVWHLVMATTMLAMLPPVIVVVTMQKLFVKGLVETEK